MNDAKIQKAIMIDTVHEHEFLIFLFGFNVHVVSKVTYLYSNCVNELCGGKFCKSILCVLSLTFIFA